MFPDLNKDGLGQSKHLGRRCGRYQRLSPVPDGVKEGVEFQFQRLAGRDWEGPKVDLRLQRGIRRGI